MMRNCKSVGALALLLGSMAWSVAGGARAADAQPSLDVRQANDFAQLFVNTCMAHFGDVPGLLEKLQSSTRQIPANLNGAFLGGGEGVAFAIPNKIGRYVVALRTDGICSVFVHEADVATMEKRFTAIATNTAEGSTAEKIRDEARQEPGRGMHTVIYTWTIPKVTRKAMLTLTTAVGADADIQGMMSLAIVSDE
ncbi:NMCC_0638 family (lipo)protein [Pokkaliibacter sp. CJK22405]|uniref:NMCC_0638 family (lipo)protein n=1 Tax=Pokkaliibacter sp. CJK22405 TaxID=3384615 RepID=UPI003984D0D3